MDTQNLKRAAILDDAIRVFGRFGYKKTSVNDIAAAAGLSKPGLYLHFSGKEEIFRAAMEKYLSDALKRVASALARTDLPAPDRLAVAMNEWFGQHLLTFTAEIFDTIESGDKMAGKDVTRAKGAFKKALGDALVADGFDPSSAAERAEVLFLCGLSWKQPGTTPEQFRTTVATAIRVCCATSSS